MIPRTDQYGVISFNNDQITNAQSCDQAISTEYQGPFRINVQVMTNHDISICVNR